MEKNNMYGETKKRNAELYALSHDSLEAIDGGRNYLGTILYHIVKNSIIIL